MVLQLNMIIIKCLPFGGFLVRSIVTFLLQQNRVVCEESLHDSEFNRNIKILGPFAIVIVVASAEFVYNSPLCLESQIDCNFNYQQVLGWSGSELGPLQ